MNITETRRQVLITRRDSGVAVVLLDCPGKLNSLGTVVLAELTEALRTVASDDSIKAVAFLSGKADTFIVGADLFEIRKATNEADLLKLASDGQETLNAVANLNKPIVVAINGVCLGGGLELALSAHWRIATDVPATQLGLPETRLGIVPGLGGTQRLPRLVGLKQALGLILTAEPIGAQEALNIGLVDELVSPDELMAAAEKRALALISDPGITAERRLVMGTKQPNVGWPLKDVDEEKATKLFAMTERSIRIKTKGHYPAQTRVLDVMKTGLTKGIEAGLELEGRTFAELAVSETSANLIALFFQTDFAKQSAAALATKFGEDNTKRIGIIGGGTMGASIADIAAAQNIDVQLKVNPGRSADARERLNNDAINCVEDYSALSDCQLVVECVREDLGIKQQVLKQIEQAVSPQCVIATNTSSLPLSELASALQSNDRFVGLHFFHPVERMPLVEIISVKSTSRKAVARVADLVTKLGKIPLMVKDGPGFLINRLLTCYLLEAARLVEEGVPLNWIDDAAVDFGMPIGPYQVLDEVGLELGYAIADGLYRALGERMRPLQLLENIPRLGLVGKKAGAGVYLYESDRRTDINPKVAGIEGLKVSTEKPDQETRETIVQRLMFPMIDEAARCLEDRIVMKPREVDMAIVYGIGFPPFRGGLLKYADHVGLEKVAATIEELHDRKGVARDVSPLIAKYVAEGRGFYSRGGKEEE